MNPDWWTPLTCHTVTWNCHVQKHRFPLLLAYDVYLVRYRNADVECPDTDVIGFSKYAGTNKAFWRDMEWGMSDVSLKSIMTDAQIISWTTIEKHRLYFGAIYENISSVLYSKVGGIVAIYPISKLGHK